MHQLHVATKRRSGTGSLNPTARFRKTVPGETVEDLYYQLVLFLHHLRKAAYEHQFVDETKLEASADRHRLVWGKHHPDHYMNLNDNDGCVAGEQILHETMAGITHSAGRMFQ